MNKRKSPLPSLHKKRFSRRDAKILGNELGVNWKKVRLSEFVRGLNVEREHLEVLDNVKELGKTVLDHLKELPDYYTRLEHMERDAKSNKRKGSLTKRAAVMREPWRVKLATLNQKR